MSLLIGFGWLNVDILRSRCLLKLESASWILWNWNNVHVSKFKQFSRHFKLYEFSFKDPTLLVFYFHAWCLIIWFRSFVYFVPVILMTGQFFVVHCLHWLKSYLLLIRFSTLGVGNSVIKFKLRNVIALNWLKVYRAKMHISTYL